MKLPRRFSLVFVLLIFIFFVGIFLIYQYFRLSPCRKWFGAPQSETGINNIEAAETEIKYMKLLNAKFCLLDIGKTQDSQFPHDSLKVTIGFFDRWWRLHRYSARIGGKLNDGTPIKASFCVPANIGYKCRLYSVDEVKNTLVAGSIIAGHIITSDSAPWQNSIIVNKHQGTINKIVAAAKKGKGFPKVTNLNDFLLQIWQIEI